MSSNIINLVKELAKGGCGCQYNMGSFSPATFDPMTGKTTPGHCDRGPRTHYCRRCQARAALEADGIEYVKDDSRNWEQFFKDHPGTKLDVCAAPVMPQGVVTITGEYTFGPDGVKATDR